MAWSAPMTAIATAYWTVNQFNIHVRDNLLETETQKIAAAGDYLVGSGINSLSTRTPATASVATSQNTTSTTPTNLTTPGPAVTVDTGTKAFVSVSASMQSSVDNRAARLGVDVTGATTITTSDSDYWLAIDGLIANNPWQGGMTRLLDLTAGSNTFTVKYWALSDTATFAVRNISVLPL